MPFPRGGVSLQPRMLAAGGGTTYVVDKPFREVSEFRRLERGARRDADGVYGMCNGNFRREE